MTFFVQSVHVCFVVLNFKGVRETTFDESAASRQTQSRISPGIAGANVRERPGSNRRFCNAVTMILEHADIDQQLRGDSPRNAGEGDLGSMWRASHTQANEDEVRLVDFGLQVSAAGQGCFCVSGHQEDLCEGERSKCARAK